MRFGLGLVGLLVVLAVVAVLAKKQLGVSHVVLPSATGQPAQGGQEPANVRQQSQQIQQQFKQQLDSAMQQQRPMPQDAE